jgi:hypothetical protein
MMNMYAVYHYNEGMVVIDFITNDRPTAIDKHRELGGWDSQYHITRCENVEIVE